MIGGIMTDEIVDFVATSNALGGEVGELQNIVKKITRDGVFYDQHALHDELVLEAGDVLHYLMRLLTAEGVSVDRVIARNIGKLEERKLQHALALAAQADSIPSVTPQR